MDKWLFGRDNSGDIRRVENIQEIWAHCRATCAESGLKGAAMVTADGSVDCQVGRVQAAPGFVRACVQQCGGLRVRVCVRVWSWG